MLLVTLAVVLGVASPANAALTAALPTASPSDTSAMAYSNYVIDSTFGADNDGQSPRSVQFDLPKGQLGAVQNATICSDANFNADNCAASSQIGEVLVNGNAVAIGFINIDVAAVGGIYRLGTTGTEAARIGIVADDPAAQPLFIVGTMRIRDASSYGITAFVNNVPNTATADLFGMGVDVDVSRMRMTLYGRVGGGASGNGFMFNPAECIAATTVVRAYAGVGYTGAVHTANRAYTPTNCAGAPYNPALTFGPAGTAGHTATAFNVNVSQPYNATDAKVGSPFKTTVVNMPPGISLTGSTKSDGTLAVCSDAQFSVNALTPDTCPAASDVGNVTLDSPLVGALNGDVFLAQPQAGPNDIIRLFFVAEQSGAADAVRVKLLARVEVNPTTGEMTATLDNLPAQPVKSFNFTFRTSPSQAVRQPRLCGTYPGDADLTSYSSSTPVSRSGNYTVTTNCGGAGRFNPTIGMTTSPNTAGATTTGVTTLAIPVGDEALTSTTVSLPPGMIAMLSGQARCTIAQATANTCAVGTQVGSVLAVAGQTGPGSFTGNVYLTDAPDASSIAGLYINVPMQVGPIFVGNVAIQAKLVLRPDFGVDVVATIPDAVRGIQLDQQSLQLTFNKANFLLNPPVCTGNTVEGQFGSAQGTTRSASSAITITGCGSMAFAPTLAFSAAPASAGGASSFTTTVTQPASTASVFQSPPKTIAVTLPDGVSLSPSANSDGNLAGCSDAQFTKSDFAAPTCPAGSNVGSVVIQTPSIGRLAGSVYLGTAVSGHTARVLVDAVSDDYGTRARVKLEGLLDVNATTGATTIAFDGIPPVNFTSFSLTMRGGTNPVLSMPRTCGTPAGSSTMTPHSGSVASPTATLTINVNCSDASSFSPTFATTFSSYAAGANTTMTTTVGVPERHRALDRITLNLPAGLLANIAGATRCTIAAANAGTCAVASKIGDVTALAGQGTTPGTFNGSLYLTDAPSAGDVVGIAVELPAVVGPVDLGKVITIASVKLRPADYGIDVVANVPTDAKGVALHLRSLQLQINKSGFLTNPVTCASTPVTSTLRSVGGSTATPTAAFQATGCASLAFNPSLAFSATPQAAAGASAFTTTITAPAGGAALKTAVVDLPTGVSLSSSINSAGNLTGCSAAQFSKTDFADPTCPAASDIGDATIAVPQVGTLTGDVYLTSATPSGAIAGLYLDAKSPTFGSAVRVKLDGKVDVDQATGKTTATFDNAPAVAFTSFQLALRGGTAPAISVPRTCGTPAGSASLSPQSGSAVTRNATLTIDANCGVAASFGATGSVSLSNLNAGADTNLTTTINVPAGHRELAKVAISLPAGLLANIDGKTRCSVAAATAGTCSAATEIGTVAAQAGQGTTPGAFNGGKAYLVDAPSAGDIVGIGLSIPVVVGPVDLGKVNVIASVKVRSDYGIDITADVPTTVKGIPMYLRQLQIVVNKSGLLFNPSTCGSKTSTLALTSASYAGASSNASDSSSQTITNCAGLAFNPTVAFSAAPASAGGSSAFTTRITLPSSPAQSALKDATVTLPDGVSLSPSLNSDGNLVGCTDAQFNQAAPFAAPTCPAASDIGSVAIQTASIGAINGDAYLASTAPGHVARIFIYADSVTYPGTRVKFSGVVDSNAGTGVATATFTGAPEVPFTEFAITFRGGTTPAISMPRTCGTPQGSASLTGHAGNPAVSRTANLTVDQNCADSTSFAPTLTNVISPTKASANSTLTTTINVPERHRALDRITLNLPAGLLANVAGAPRCTIAAASAGTCAIGTKIGTVAARAGQGTVPGTFNGNLYLTDAPTPATDVVGIAVELPAVVGPVDLGKIVTIAAVKLRPADYGIDVVADVPTSIQGIPLHLRQLTLTVDKSGFLTNPATCAAGTTNSTLRSVGGSTATPSVPFTATSCNTLGFNPAVSFSASPAQASGASAFTTRITAPASTAGNEQGALKKAVVDLPTGVSLSSSINSAGNLVGCSAAQFAQSAFTDPTCPAASDIGDATIDVPQVGTLSGDIYLATTAPSGAIAGLYLDASSAAFGDSVRVKLDGKVDVDPATGKTTATFDNAPAIAFTNFQLTLRGGTNPATSMPRTCGTPTGTATITPQTGSTVTRTGTLTIDQNCASAGNFAATGAVSLSTTAAGQDTNLTTTVNVPAGGRELGKVEISLPAGLLANIEGKTRCTVAAAQAGTCAAGAEIGTISATAGQGTTPGTFGGGKVYLVDAPSASDIVGLGLSIPVVVGPVDLGKVNVVASVKLRSDYGIDITADVPTDVKGIPMYLRSLQILVNKPNLLFNPSTCGVKTSTLTMTSASYGGSTTTAPASTTNTTIDSCGALAFNPSLEFSATPAKAGGSGAFTTKITLPSSPAQSALKTATVQLPSGLSLSPSIDSGGNLTGCTAAQLDQATPSVAPTCPAASKIGTTTIQTASVGAMTGDVYLAASAPGHLAGVYVYAGSASFPGARVKMTGVVDVDENTGLTWAVFGDAPEVPFTEFAITFRGGDNPALSLPRVCGSPQGSATLTSHAGGAPVGRSGTLTIDQNCGAAGFTPTSTTVTTSPTTAAAATSMLTTITLPEGQQELSRVRLSLPAGLIAKIDGRQRCSVAAATAGTCAAGSKIGTLTAKAGQGATPATFSGGTVYLTDAPGAGDLVGLAIELPVKVGSVGGNAIVDLGKLTAVGGISLRTDYGIDIDMAVPTKIKGIPTYLRQIALNINEPGFMVNPATCTGNAYSGTLNAVQGGSAPISGSLSVTGCAGASFNPSVAFSAAPARPAASSAFTTTISVPADHSPVKTAAVTLPAGVSLSASANAGGDLVGCTAGQFDAASWADPTCGAGSKIGTVSIQTPSVGAITGDAYLAATTPNGTIASLYLDAQSTAFGAKARIKVTGTVAVDAGTGATVATFDNLPGVAFTSFALTLRGGASPVVSLPRTCGSFAGSALLTPHAGSASTKNASLVLDQACPAAGQFGPQVDFDLSPNGAGDAGKLTTTITVPGGDQELSKVRIDMPEGLTAKLKDALRCTIANAQLDNCAANTEIGTVVAKVGVDGASYSQSGKVYLTEGRAGNVAGMAIILPAVVGPIDLGKVITVADIQLKSPDLALQITADVPTSVKGVRLDLRELKLNITKDDFLVNPSSCGTLPGTAAFTGKDGATAADTASITVPAGTCATQNFDPQISFDAGNPKPGESSDFTTSVAVTDQPGPESPFKAVNVRLPEGMSLSASAGARGDLDGCTDAEFKQDDLAAASSCPAGSEIGTVRFETGELAGDLDGKVYLAPATNGNLARIFLETTSSTIANLTVRLIGRVEVNETTGATDAIFDEIPAIPVTRFTVKLRGGDAPTLALPRLCGTAQGTGTFVPVSGTATQTRNAGLALSTDCPDANAFSPTVTLDRSTQAAGRSMTFTTTVDVPAKQQELSSLRMVLPAGLLGNISQIPACSFTDAKAGTCAASSKVGDVTAQAGVASAPFALEGAAYLVKGDSNSIARLAIVLPAKVGPVDLGDVITIAELKLRADYGLTITADDVPTKVKGVRVDLHKLELAINKPGFMVNPVSCTPAQGTTTMGSAQGGTQQRQQDFFTTGCDQLKLDASLGFDASPASPLTASAVTTKINASAPSGDALDAMKNIRVTLPEQTSLSASAGAKGDLAECTAGEFKASDIDVDAACPAGSKVGNVGISSPMIGDLTGDVFLGAKTDGHFAGIFLQAKAAEYPSLRVKIAGSLDVDETTGRMIATFQDLPQVQVSAINLQLRGGDAPVLSLPRTCGTFGADVNVLRHGGAASDATGNLVLDQDCPDVNAFAPKLDLSVSPTQAGASTALNTKITVPARHQELRNLDLAMPNGLLGRLTVAPKCSLDAARANACSDASQVGSASAKVGVATAPYGVSGKVFLTDGFDGSIAGLMFALPAKVGPIDLGTVVTLAQIKLVGSDLQMRITANDIPTRVKGIPLSISELSINVDKPGMVLNATSCSAQQAKASFGSAQGGSASSDAGYQASGCESLNWQPSLKVGFSGPPAEMKAKGHPTLTTVIQQAEGQGNMKSAVVTLPVGVATDLTNVNKRSCANPETAIAGGCPESSKLGAGEIVTSALPEPVDATLYIVKIPNVTLPGVAIHVRDQIAFDIIGTTKLDKAGRLVASFDNLPDTPISKMTLVFNGGSTGVLQLGKEICGVKGLATDGTLGSHHGASKNLSVPVDCNGTSFGGNTPTDPNVKSLASATFRPEGSSSALTFALSNPNGISKLVLKMPKGAIFTKKAYKMTKLTLTGAKAKTNIVNGERRMAISIKPTVAGEKVTKVKFKLPNKAIRINYKIRRVLADKKTSKKKKAKLLAKLLSPSITVLDGTGTATDVKLKVAVSAK